MSNSEFSEVPPQAPHTATSHGSVDTVKEEDPENESDGVLKAKAKGKPDHGENFVPGAEAAPSNLAPQPLDHFKRGYRERAELRDREMSHLNMDFENNSKQALKDRTRWERNANLPTSESEKYHVDVDRDVGVTARSNIPMGFEVSELVDRLSSPGCSFTEELDYARNICSQSFDSGKAITAVLSLLARRKKMGIALAVWQWMEQSNIERNVFHFNSLISVCEKMKDWKRALTLLDQMQKEGVKKNEVTFSSAISACEKSGNWRMALELLQRMKQEGITRTAIAYNAAISACEKGLNPSKALEVFEQMKKEGVRPTVITYSALISACEKGQQWKLALEVLEEMKADGHGANVIAYSAAISALSKGQQWEKALELFREIEKSGGRPSVVTYNATMTALEKGLQWERALDLFDEMKYKRLPVTVVSYGSAISACEKGYQWRQCLDYLDEMTEMSIRKNVIIFGAAMSCMEKCCRPDIAFLLMDRMKMEGVSPNVHIYNSAISACARCGLWEKGLELFNAMDRVGVVKDVVTYNAVLDAVCSQVQLARRLFQEGVERGFYARVSRLGTQWLELDLHFLSLGGGEIALGWWFEECLVPYLGNSSKLAAVKSIDIVTGYGKTRMRGARQGDDGMRKRVRAMLRFMRVHEINQPNKGRIHIDKVALQKEVEKNNGRINFDLEGYRRFRAEETTANVTPNVVQVRRGRIGPNETTEDVKQEIDSSKGHMNENYEGRDERTRDEAAFRYRSESDQQARRIKDERRSDPDHFAHSQDAQSKRRNEHREGSNRNSDTNSRELDAQFPRQPDHHRPSRHGNESLPLSDHRPTHRHSPSPPRRQHHYERSQSPPRRQRHYDDQAERLWWRDDRRENTRDRLSSYQQEMWERPGRRESAQINFSGRSAAHDYRRTSDNHRRSKQDHQECPAAEYRERSNKGDPFIRDRSNEYSKGKSSGRFIKRRQNESELHSEAQSRAEYPSYERRKRPRHEDDHHDTPFLSGKDHRNRSNSTLDWNHDEAGGSRLFPENSGFRGRGGNQLDGTERHSFDAYEQETSSSRIDQSRHPNLDDTDKASVNSEKRGYQSVKTVAHIKTSTRRGYDVGPVSRKKVRRDNQKSDLFSSVDVGSIRGHHGR